LGISFAQGGKKTLILDADLRRAVQHRYFELDRKPGLTNYLLHEEASLSEIIHSTGIPNLSLITSGSFPPNPAELLASQAMKRLLNELRTMFDIVLIDSPPVTVCSDPLILGEITDGIIVIAKTESTQLRGLAHAVNMIRRLHIEIMGVVLNQAEMRYGWTYYYIYRRYRPYSYYGYSYTYGHGEEEAADDDQRWNQGKSKRT
jgi:tyrosine-protein kinase Etk/Wzc